MESELILTVTKFGYLAVFFGVLAESVGLPIPSMLIVVVGGSLAANGLDGFLLVVLLATIAAFLGDWLWFAIGRKRGNQILGLLCRISISPDSCVSGAKGVFAKYGPKSLLVAKFVPGFSTFAPPIAGASGMSVKTFAILNLAGAVIWAGTFALLGLIFSDQIEWLIKLSEDLSFFAAIAIFAALLALIGWKLLQRYRLIRQFRLTRINAFELKDRLDRKEEVVILDMRAELDLQADPEMLPGAIRAVPETLELSIGCYPKDTQIVLYCSCPNEFSSARAAMAVRKLGYLNVRPLQGGILNWRQHMGTSDTDDFATS